MYSLALRVLFTSALIAKAIALFKDESPGDFFFFAINSSFSCFQSVIIRTDAPPLAYLINSSYKDSISIWKKSE